MTVKKRKIGIINALSINKADFSPFFEYSTYCGRHSDRQTLMKQILQSHETLMASTFKTFGPAYQPTSSGLPAKPY